MSVSHKTNYNKIKKYWIIIIIIIIIIIKPVSCHTYSIFNIIKKKNETN